MSEHVAAIAWSRGDQPFTDKRYSRAHDWTFDGGAVVRGSSAPSSVRIPFSDPSAVDPEEALVASLSSCHMLWFLDFAARAGLVVDRYVDQASGVLGHDSAGRRYMSEVTLRPVTAFAGRRSPAGSGRTGPAALRGARELRHGQLGQGDGPGRSLAWLTRRSASLSIRRRREPDAARRRRLPAGP